MSTANESVVEVPEVEGQEPVKQRVFQPEIPIEGWVTIETGRREEQRGGKRNRQTHYMHGLCLPGIGVGRDRRTGNPIKVARNRFLLPDNMSYDWFKEMMAMPVLPPELEGISVRMSVKTFLDENIAFVRPLAYSQQRAVMEWKTRKLRITAEAVESMSVKDDKSLCHVFYTRGFARTAGEAGTIARILPNEFKALVVMNNGYFYELAGAERLQRHIGRAGTNGMILDRDIEIALTHRQIYDPAIVERMMNDPDGYTPLV